MLLLWVKLKTVIMSVLSTLPHTLPVVSEIMGKIMTHTTILQVLCTALTHCIQVYNGVHSRIAVCDEESDSCQCARSQC